MAECRKVKSRVYARFKEIRARRRLALTHLVVHRRNFIRMLRGVIDESGWAPTFYILVSLAATLFIIFTRSYVIRQKIE